MAVLLQSLRLIDPLRIHPPKNYIFTGSEITEQETGDSRKIKETIDCSSFFAS